MASGGNAPFQQISDQSKFCRAASDGPGARFKFTCRGAKVEPRAKINSIVLVAGKIMPLTQRRAIKYTRVFARS